MGECKVLGDLTHEQIAAIPKTSGVSYSRPIDPRIAAESEAEENERNLVRVLQCAAKTPLLLDCWNH